MDPLQFLADINDNLDLSTTMFDFQLLARLPCRMKFFLENQHLFELTDAHKQSALSMCARTNHEKLKKIDLNVLYNDVLMFCESGECKEDIMYICCDWKFVKSLYDSLWKDYMEMVDCLHFYSATEKTNKNKRKRHLTKQKKLDMIAFHVRTHHVFLLACQQFCPSLYNYIGMGMKKADVRDMKSEMTLSIVWS